MCVCVCVCECVCVCVRGHPLTDRFVVSQLFREPSEFNAFLVYIYLYIYI